MISQTQVEQISTLRGSQSAALAKALQEELYQGIEWPVGSKTTLNIVQVPQVRQFLTQMLTETLGFTEFEENLIYTSPARLVAVWPDRFNYNGTGNGPLDATKYVRNSQGLANAVYALRYGNGNTASGDGYRYRGRGGFHLTFRDNYRKCSTDLFGDQRLVTNPDQVASDLNMGIRTAIWFWAENNLGSHCVGPNDGLTAVTTLVNGSAATVPERLVYYNKVLKAVPDDHALVYPADQSELDKSIDSTEQALQTLNLKNVF